MVTQAGDAPSAGGNAEEWWTVAGLIRHWAAEAPDRPALTQDDRTLTWSELYRLARRVAAALVDEGVRAGDRVAFLDRNGIDFFAVAFGGALVGAVGVPVNWRLAPAEMRAIVDDAQAPVLFYGPDYADAATEIAAGVAGPLSTVALDDLDGWLDAHDAARDPAPGPDGPPDPGYQPVPDDVVLQLYTSGTTGLPKGVMLTNDNMTCSLAEAEVVFRIDADTVSLVAMPLFHIGGSGWALAGMSRGGHSVILREVDPAEALRLIARHGVTETFVVPALLLFLLATPDLASTDVTSLRTVFYGASPISEDLLVRSMEALGCDLAQLYGLTETTGAITSLAPEDHDPDGPRAHLLRSAGRPLGHVELRIVDPDTGEDLGAGDVGEIWTRSRQNMAGYWAKPDDTASALREGGWFRTGDAGWIDDEGYLFLHDRLKDMIVSGGENIYPAEVENAVAAHPDVADVAVIGVPDDRWGETVKAIVVRVPGGTDDDVLAADIVAFTRDRLAHFKCPTSVTFTDTLPRTASGKILKRELRDPYWVGLERNIH